MRQLEGGSGYPKVQLTEDPPFGLWSRHGDPLLMEIPHRHNELELNLLESGSIQYLFPRQRIDIQEGQLFLFWAGVPHQLVGKADVTHIHWMTFPLAWLLRWKLPEAWIQVLLRGQPAISEDFSTHDTDLAAFYRWHEDLETSRLERKEILLLELEARIRRLSLASEHSVRTVERDAASIRMGGRGETRDPAERLAGYLAENFAGEWSPEVAARVVGLHPNYAMSLFRRMYGVSMGTYVTQLRVAMAQTLLATSEADILDIAYECGFGSVSRFYAAFKSITLTSPRQYRASMRGTE